MGMGAQVPLLPQPAWMHCSVVSACLIKCLVSVTKVAGTHYFELRIAQLQWLPLHGWLQDHIWHPPHDQFWTSWDFCLRA
jgi:hypothetical protein